MRYQILGPTRALRPDGTVLPVGGARLRALLTALALRADRTVPVSVLVDDVWGTDTPADATAALQALVGRLRRTLGAEAVVLAEGGYRLAVDPDRVDLHRFERLAALGARTLAAADPARAATVLDEALALRGEPALADLPDRAAEAARHHALHLAARRDRLTAALALGEAREALPELTALCAEHPLDEPLQALRIRALRQSGRAAEALAAYDTVRLALADRLGTDPGPELRALHAELLAAPGPAAVPAPAAAPGPAAVPAPAAAPGPAAGPAHPGNLPARLTSFVGRDADLDAVRADLGRTRLVTLLGPGGAGKTRLSLEVADRVAADHPDGVWFAELAPVESPEDVPEAVLTALGARETVLRGSGAEELRAVAEVHAKAPLTRLAEYCAHRRMLLVLDNCEHVVTAAARLAEHLVAHCPGVTVLATSREPLAVPGESLHPVGPLPDRFALRLFADRGAAARPGFRAGDDPEAAAEICQRLDGLPLAIELAAARLRMLTARQIADRLDDRFRLLTGGARTALPRQQTLRAVVDWSWELLDEDERTVLRRLSVFAGGCDLAATEEVCGPAALDALGALVDKSLVVAAPGPDGPMRYRLLETVAEYAAERLDEAGDRAAAERAHLVHYRELARTTDPLLRGAGQLAAIRRLTTEYENLRTALRHAVAVRDEQEALCLVLSLSWFWQLRALRTDARTWSQEVGAMGPDPFAPPVVPALPLPQSPIGAPPPMAQEVLAEARRGVHLVHFSCLDTELDRWQTPQGQARIRGIAQAYRPSLPQVCRNPGHLWFFAVILTQDPAALRAAADAAVVTCRELGLGWELGQALQARSVVTASRPEWQGDAARDADEALTIFRELGDGWGAAEALSARGELYERKGDFAGAAADYEEAIAYSLGLGAHRQVAVLRARLAGVWIESEERAAQGEACLRTIIDELPDHGTEAMPAARLFLAMHLGRTGRRREAREQVETLRTSFAAAGFVVFDSLLSGVEGWLDTLDGRYASGAERLRHALDASRDPLCQMVAPQLVGTHLLTAAHNLAERDGGARTRDAVRLFGAHRALLPPGLHPKLAERDSRAVVEAAGVRVLGPEAYRAALVEGGSLDLDGALALL
ncbi:BTAD domain-containing putative transcriptional regulator [Streptomyces sp. NPDC002490]|uniref:AfsR/SARP family transcriptional regulator n=1 Tax=Streptomyces sp. NPDC002490 TaxID=3154416 RepID=UPI003325AF7F